MDFTEIPYAEDFAAELDYLIEEYLTNRGLPLETIKDICKMVCDEMEDLTGVE